MIERVLVAGADVDLADVFASLTLRHGRASADDLPLASTASLSLVNVTRELVRSFSSGDALEILLADDVPRFRGRISDCSLGPDGLSIVAVSSLSWISRRTIGAVDWPAELWSARVLRAFNEAGILLEWQEAAGTWAELDPAQTWAQPELAPRLTVLAGADEPMLAARPAAEVTLGAYLGDLAASHPAAIANLPSGSVLVQGYEIRAGLAPVELDPDVVAFAPEWSMIDDVENEVEVTYAGGSELATDPDSIERFESRPQKITTELENEPDASILAGLRVARRSTPRWQAEPLDLLELEPAIGIGSPVRVVALPDWAPAGQSLGIVEGWEDQIEPADEPDSLAWTMRLLLSDPRLSGGFGVPWISVPADIAWSDAGAATWAEPEPLIE